MSLSSLVPCALLVPFILSLLMARTKQTARPSAGVKRARDASDDSDDDDYESKRQRVVEIPQHLRPRLLAWDAHGTWSIRYATWYPDTCKDEDVRYAIDRALCVRDEHVRRVLFAQEVYETDVAKLPPTLRHVPFAEWGRCHEDWPDSIVVYSF